MTSMIVFYNNFHVLRKNCENCLCDAELSWWIQPEHGREGGVGDAGELPEIGGQKSYDRFEWRWGKNTYGQHKSFLLNLPHIFHAPKFHFCLSSNLCEGL